MNYSSAIIIPCYNERDRLPPFLNELLSTPTLKATLIVLVEDGSQERVPEIRDPRVVQLYYPDNQGKGYCVRYGWNWVLENYPEISTLGFADADGAVSASEAARLLQLFIDKPCAMLMASRVLMLGRKVERKFIRHLIGRVFATVLSHQLNVMAYDTQCGCKWIQRTSYLKTKNQLQINGYTFDAELMARLLQKGEVILEEPVDWKEISGSKVRLWADSWAMFQQLRSIKKTLQRS